MIHISGESTVIQMCNNCTEIFCVQDKEHIRFKYTPLCTFNSCSKNLNKLILRVKAEILHSPPTLSSYFSGKCQKLNLDSDFK